MTTQQKASGGKSRSSRKSAPKVVAEAQDQNQDQAIAEKQPKEIAEANSAPGEFKPLALPVEGTPLARKEVAERLAEHSSELGITLTTNGEGNVVVEEQRQGERRQEERRQEERRGLQAASEPTNEAQAEVEAEEKAVQEETVEHNKSSVSEANNTEPTNEPETPTGNVLELPKSPEAANLAAFQQAMKELAEKMGINPDNIVNLGVATTPSSGRPHKNGITRPGIGTKTEKVWAIADAITEQKKVPAGIGDLMQHPDLRHFNTHTIRTQYARWRQYNGVKGRTESAPRQNAGSRQQEVQWPAMPDSEYMRYQEMEREGKLDDGFKPWMMAETSRRNAIREAVKEKVVSVKTENAEVMSDEVYNKLLTFENNNTLPENMMQSLKEEKARRGER